jgi:hypothetical protein
MSKIKLYIILLHLILIQNVYGYLDPGTWSYFLQILAVIVVGGIVGIKTFWHNIKNFFFKLLKIKQDKL